MNKPSSPPEWALTTTARLSSRLSVELTFGPGGMVCEWTPDRPDILGITLNDEELTRYRAARDELTQRRRSGWVTTF